MALNLWISLSCHLVLIFCWVKHIFFVINHPYFMSAVFVIFTMLLCKFAQSFLFSFCLGIMEVLYFLGIPWNYGVLFVTLVLYPLLNYIECGFCCSQFVLHC